MPSRVHECNTIFNINVFGVKIHKQIFLFKKKHEMYPVDNFKDSILIAWFAASDLFILLLYENTYEKQID